MDYQQEYERWCAQPLQDADLTEELHAIQGQKEEVYDRFYRSLEFGTAGLRGVLGAGTNRMNIYTVGLATQGLACYLLEQYEAPSVAIAYDSRIKSDLFAREAARVLAANGVQVHLYPQLMPTPALSFAVRHLHCQAGIVVTASHNPAKYNGYKVYGPDGCQLTEKGANAVLQEMNQRDLFRDVLRMDFDQALQEEKVRYIGQDTIEAYLQAVLTAQVNPGVCPKAGLKVVYTPLNGAGNYCVRQILSRIGVADVTVVPEQEQPDGNFPTCPYPNPEIRQALAKGLELCERVQPDLLLATDPDSDRVGIAVRDQGTFHLLTGNQVGVLLTDYIARSRTEQGTLPENPIVVKTIVTTTMVNAVAEKYGIQVVNVLTGFKYIGEQIGLLEQKNEVDRFLLGFEESYGYLSGPFVRDKDAVNGSMLICEMASYYKLQGKTLLDVLRELYEELGYYYNTVDSYAFEGANGMRQMQAIMEQLRENPPKEIGGLAVVGHGDYLLSKRWTQGGEAPIHLPKSNVLEYQLENGGTVIARPSGTEPKLKIYYSLVGRDETETAALKERLSQALQPLLGQ